MSIQETWTSGQVWEAKTGGVDPWTHLLQWLHTTLKFAYKFIGE